MKPTWLNLIMIIFLTILLTYGTLHLLDGVSISFIKKAQYTELLTIAQQSRERIAGLELQLGEFARVYGNLNRILTEKQVIP